MDKGVRATPAAPLAERTCMVFDGTTVLAGTAYAVVVATGEATEAGRATRAAGRAGAAAGLQARLGEVTRKALPATLLGGATVTGLATLRRLPLRQAVAAGVSVAVAAVPEGLPLVATVAEAAAARRLSRRGVLVVSSRTLEALGRVDVVCFDKTGTLTEGRLAVSRLASATGDLEPDEPAARRLLTAAARACPPAGTDSLHTVPHATDRAVLEATARLAEEPAGDHREDRQREDRQRRDWQREDWQLGAELPFETNRGYAASFGTVDGESLLVVKGAPEVVLALCSRVATGKRAARRQTAGQEGAGGRRGRTRHGHARRNPAARGTADRAAACRRRAAGTRDRRTAGQPTGRDRHPRGSRLRPDRTRLRRGRRHAATGSG